jgi:hypothetical protein
MILEFLIVFALGCWIGWRASAAWQVIVIKKLLEDLGVTTEQLKKIGRAQGLTFEDDAREDSQPDPEQFPVLEVRVEQQPEGLFAYRKSDSQFLAQGRDRESLMQNLVNNLTNVRVVVAKEDGADLITP